MSSNNLNLPEYTINLTHNKNPVSEIQAYTEAFVLKGPHTVKFTFTGDTAFTKIIYNFDYTLQCESTTQPSSGLTVIEPTRQSNNSLFLIDPSHQTIQTDLFPDKYQFQKTYYPGITTIDEDFNTVVHQLSVTIAQPSLHQFVDDVNLAGFRSFTNIDNDVGKAVVLLEDTTNNWLVPLTLYGEGEFTGVLNLGDTLYGKIKFDICLKRAPYDNFNTEGVQVVGGGITQGDPYLGSVKYGTFKNAVENFDFSGAVREEFTLTNTGDYILYVTNVTPPSVPFYLDGSQLVGQYSPADSGCENERSEYVYYTPPKIEQLINRTGIYSSSLPTEPLTDADQIVITNTSSNNPNVTVDVVAETKIAMLDVVTGFGDTNSNVVQFKPTLLGDQSTAPVKIENKGTCPVKVFDIVPHLTDAIGTVGAVDPNPEIIPDNIKLPFVLLPGEVRTIDAIFRPTVYSDYIDGTGGGYEDTLISTDYTGVKVDKKTVWRVVSNAFNNVRNSVFIEGDVFSTTTTTTTTSTTTTTTSSTTSTTTISTSLTTSTTTSLTTTTTSVTCPTPREELYVRWQYQPSYVVEGSSVHVYVVRDPKSDYNGRFTVDYTTVDVSATSTGPNANKDYTSASGTLTFEPGVMSQVITINTFNRGGSKLTGIDAVIDKLETAELFNIELSNIVTDDFCANKYYIDPANPTGINANSILNPPTHSVIILDQFIHSNTSISLGTGGGGKKCTFTSVTSVLDLTTLILSVDGATSNTDKIIKVYNSDTGVLLGIVPANGSIDIDVSGQSRAGSDTLNVTFESCGCCVLESYNYPCTWVNITGELTCCTISNVVGSMTCCSITDAKGVMSCE